MKTPKTFLLDKNCELIKNGDIVNVRATLKDYPGLYHYGQYKVEIDPIRGLSLSLIDLIHEGNINNQLIGTNTFLINKHISLWRWDSDPQNNILYCKFNIEGDTFVKINPTDDIEKVKL